MAARRLVPALLGFFLLVPFLHFFNPGLRPGSAISPVGEAREAEAAALGWWAYETGRSYRSPSGYIEFVPGDAPIVVSVPHGGVIEPEAIPDRRGVTDRDVNTIELGRLFVEEYHRLTGRRPHLVINLLHRKKLDANREIGEAAEGNPVAEEAWREFHGFIDAAKSYVLGTFGWGFYIDLHGHAHAHQRVELGYALSVETLRLSDELLNRYREESTLQPACLQEGSGMDLASLLRGPESLGTRLERLGVPSVPSAQAPAPLEGWRYFSGGYNVERHGALGGGTVHGVQIEVSANWRATPASLVQFARALAEATDAFVRRAFGDCRFLRLHSEESGALLQTVALPKFAAEAEVFVAGERVSQSERLPEALAIPTSRLDQGRHPVSLTLTGARGERYNVTSQLSVRHLTLAGPWFPGGGSAPALFRGSVAVEVLPEHPRLGGVAVELRRVGAPGGAVLAEEAPLPLRLEVNTLAFEDGLYELVATARTTEGALAVDAVTVVIDNWEVIDDALLPPVEGSWFGAQSRLKAVSSSGRWDHAATRPELFGGDDSRLVPGGSGAHSLVWRLAGLDAAEIVLFAVEEVEERLSLSVSKDGSSWEPVSYELVPEESTGEWKKLGARATGVGGAEYLRVTLDATGLDYGAVQLGHVRLIGGRG